VRTNRRGSQTAIYQLDAQIGYVLRQVSQRHTTLFARMIGDGLKPMQWAVLARLYEIGVTSQTALGRAVSMDGATVKGTVDRLVKRGLAKRLHDPLDGRKILVDLTEAGRQATTRNFGRATAISRETVAPLTEAEAILLAQLLDKLK
jgi:MarR family transcriptional regulator, lower aerobic nicotinate degradation pathway regulator